MVFGAKRGLCRLSTALSSRSPGDECSLLPSPSTFLPVPAGQRRQNCASDCGFSITAALVTKWLKRVNKKANRPLTVLPARAWCSRECKLSCPAACETSHVDPSQGPSGDQKLEAPLSTATWTASPCMTPERVFTGPQMMRMFAPASASSSRKCVKGNSHLIPLAIWLSAVSCMIWRNRARLFFLWVDTAASSLSRPAIAPLSAPFPAFCRRTHPD